MSILFQRSTRYKRSDLIQLKWSSVNAISWADSTKYMIPYSLELITYLSVSKTEILKYHKGHPSTPRIDGTWKKRYKTSGKAKVKSHTGSISKMYVACLAKNSLLNGRKCSFNALYTGLQFMASRHCSHYLLLQAMKYLCCKSAPFHRSSLSCNCSITDKPEIKNTKFEWVSWQV